MTVKRWWIAALVAWLFGTAVSIGLDRVTLTVASRDIGWTPGPLSPIADWIVLNWWVVAIIMLVIAEVPAFLWRRRGESLTSTWLIAVAMPLAVLGFRLFPTGYPEDAYIPFVIVATILAGTVASFFIAIFVRPSMKTGIES